VVDITCHSRTGLYTFLQGQTKLSQASQSSPTRNQLIAVLVVPAILLASCSAGLRPPRLTPPGEIYTDLCNKIIAAEGGALGDLPVIVLARTRPIYFTALLRARPDVKNFETEQDFVDARDLAAKMDKELDTHLASAFSSLPVPFPTDHQICNWTRPSRADDDYFGSDELILELSNVFEYPFAEVGKPRFGLFARFSLGGRAGASWFWISLQPDRSVECRMLDAHDF
jgi:hypothetical protein